MMEQNVMTPEEGPPPIKRLLVAGRGEVAQRIFATCRSLGVSTVAVFSDPDADLPFVGEADVAVSLRGSTPAQTYLDVAKILAAATRSGADAVHPGYGFLAENADFAEAVLAAGLVWVGPSPQAIRSMGSKVEAKRLAVRAGVPVAPSAELRTDDEADWYAAADQVGFPLLVKASAGGGGRGMRLVQDGDDLAAAITGARREAASSFGDPTVFLERYLTGARHVEVQVFGDSQGNRVHLFERECSIQRRHQKIVEETPSPGTAPATRERMYAAALALADAVDYVGAGTVEFLVTGDGGGQEFFFLEMNTRLQVEHGVTEESTLLDLVGLQLAVAQGQPHRLVPESAWDEMTDEETFDALDDDRSMEIVSSFHAIEVRLYAEDPAAEYRPSTGRLHHFEPGRPADGSRVRWDVGVESGSEVSSYYDPMLGKVIASSETRSQAARDLAAALWATRIHGLRTNREQLVAILESAPFLAGGTPTDFLELFPELTAPQTPAELQRDHIVAAAVHGALSRRAGAAVLGFAPSGWRNVPAVPQLVAFGVADAVRTVTYDAVGPGRWDVTLDGAAVPVRVYGHVGERVDLEIDGLRRDYLVASYPDSVADETTGALVCVDAGGWSTDLRELPRFAAAADAVDEGGSTSPVPGTVTVVAVVAGDTVVVGQTLVVLEAMKMEHRITAASVSVVERVLVAVGDSVDAHQVVILLTPTPIPPTPTPPATRAP